MSDRQDAPCDLDLAWSEVENGIHTVGNLVKEVTSSDDAVGRFEGYRAALSAIMDGYINHVYAARNRPEYLPWLGQVVNYAGPSHDFKYGIVQLEPGRSYRVWGQRGGAEIVDFQLFAGWNGMEGGIKGSRSQGTFDDQGIHVDGQGRFDFTLGPERPSSGDWWEADPEATTMLIREFFTDCATPAESGVFHFEQIGFDDGGTTTETADEAAARLRSLVKALDDWSYSFRLGASIRNKTGGDNRFYEEVYADSGGQADQRFMMMRFNIPPGQALICQWRPPKDCRYWDFSLLTDHFQLLNAAYRQCSLNRTAAHITEDGMVHFVISQRDPLIANWLDLDGHHVGVVVGRAKQANEVELPVATLVPDHEVLRHLPPDVERVTPAARSAAVAARRLAYKVRERR